MISMVYDIHCRVYSHVCYSLKCVNFRLTINCFSMVRSGKNTIGAVWDQGHELIFFSPVQVGAKDNGALCPVWDAKNRAK